MEPLQYDWSVAPVVGNRHVPYQDVYVDISNNFPEKATGLLCQAIMASSKCSVEAIRLVESESWNNIDELRKAKLPYREEDFVYIVRNYVLLFRKVVRIIQRNRRGWEREPWLCPPSGTQVSKPTIRQLWEMADEAVDSLSLRLDSLIELLEVKRWHVDMVSIPKYHMVPAVSPREIRFWLLFNTDEFRDEIRKEVAKGIKSFRVFWAKREEMTEQGREGPGVPSFPQLKDYHGRSGTDDCKIGQFTPNVFFLCSGIDDQLKEAHDIVTVGATQERINNWSGLWKLRRDARRIHLNQAPRKWYDFYQNLSAIESQFDPEPNEPLYKFREELMDWRRDKNPDPPACLTPKDLAKISIIRACSHHIGQAYRQITGSYQNIDCCYSCKVSIRYREGKEVDVPFVARDFEMGKRIKLPWSCAEVASSMYCDQFPRTYQTPPPSTGSNKGQASSKGEASSRGGPSQGGGSGKRV